MSNGFSIKEKHAIIFYGHRDKYDEYLHRFGKTYKDPNNSNKLN